MQFHSPSVVHAVPGVIAPALELELVEGVDVATGAAEEADEEEAAGTGTTVSVGAVVGVDVVVGVGAGMAAVVVSGVDEGDDVATVLAPPEDADVAAKIPPGAAEAEEEATGAALETDEVSAEPAAATVPVSEPTVAELQALGPEDHPVRRFAISDA